MLGGQPVFLQEGIIRARLAESILQADAPDECGVALAERLGHGAAQPSEDAVIFRCDHTPRPPGGLYYRFFVERLDGRYVQQVDAYSFLLKYSGSLQGTGCLHAGADNGYIRAFTQDDSLAQGEMVILIEDHGAGV